MPIEELAIGRNPVNDLSSLKGMPLRSLACEETQVRSLSPLRGLPLKWLKLGGCQIENLAPLEKMSLASLWLDHNDALNDLGPLKSLPLVDLDLGASGNILSYDPICEMASLKNVSLDVNKLTKDNAAALLKLAHLEKINGGPARPPLLWHVVPQVEPRATLQASAKKIMNLVFGPDGSWLVTTSADGALQIWNVENRTLKFSVTANGSSDPSGLFPRRLFGSLFQTALAKATTQTRRAPFTLKMTQKGTNARRARPT